MNSGSHEVIAPFEWKPRIALRQAVLEDEHQQPVGGADREQVEQHRLDRDHDRPERHEQQQEAEREHEREHERRVALHLLVEVVRARRLAGHGHVDARDASDARRDHLIAKRLQRRDRGAVAAVARERRSRPSRRCAPD